MDRVSVRNPSLWMSFGAEDYGRLDGGIEKVDVAIVGGGIVGIALAHRLSGSNLKVALLEAGRIVSDVTGFTTGKLTSQHGLIYHRLHKSVGYERARYYGEANQWAIDEVRRLVWENQIDCDFEDEAAHVYSTQANQEEAFAEEHKFCRMFELPVAESVPADLLPFSVTQILRFEKQARFHPRKMLLALARMASEFGVKIFEDTRVIDIQEEIGGCRVNTEHGEVVADRVVVCTNYPIHDSGHFVAKLAPYMAYAMAANISGPLPEGMFISNDEPERSLRVQPHEGEMLLIAGGGMHKVGQHHDTYQEYLDLENWLSANFKAERVDFRWSTQDNQTPDRLPYVGLSPKRERIYLATGFGGWGMSNGFVSAKLLSDQLQGIENPWTDTFSPNRMEMAAAPSLIVENFNAVKHLVGDRIKRAEFDNFAALEPGEGGIVQLNDKRVGAFCDEAGIVHAVSSACTHMGCQVAWNSAEQTWDCPCHGSRFDIEGEVLHGPAVSALEKIHLEADIPAEEIKPVGPFLG